MGCASGWTFDPAREIWWARTGPATWSEVAGTLGNPPTWAPRASAKDTMTDYKWITEGPDFAFTDDERWEVTDTGGGFSLRENTAHDDITASEPHWELIPVTFASMDDAKTHAGTRAN